MHSIQISLLEGFYYLPSMILLKAWGRVALNLQKRHKTGNKSYICTKMQVCLSIRYHQVWQPSISQAQSITIIYLIHLFRQRANAYFSSQCDSCLNGSALLLRAQEFTSLRTHRYSRRLLQP